MTPHAPVFVNEQYQGIRALVLGASGFIGRWVARRMSEAGARLTVAVRRPSEFTTIASQWKIEADVVAFDALDDSSVSGVISAVDPDVVFNLAGYGVDRTEVDPGIMERVNTQLARHLAKTLADTPPHPGWHGRRLVHVGSALEYGLIEGSVTEDGPVDPHTDYGRTKLAGTKAVQAVANATGLHCLTARLFTVFGPGEHTGRLLPSLRKAAGSITTATLSAGSQRRDFAYVEDVAEGLLRLGISEGQPGEIVNLATGQLTTVRAFAETAALVLELPPDRLLFGSEPIRPDEMRITGVDVSRLRDRIGWTPDPDLERGIRRGEHFEAALARV